MPAKKKPVKGIASLPSHLQKGLEQLAKGAGVAVTEIWTMYVMQYVARGVAYGLLTIIPSTLIIMKYGPFFWEAMWPWVAVIIIIAKSFGLYWTVMYLLNARYYALNKLVQQVGDFVSKTKGGEVVKATASKSLEIGQSVW